MLAELPKRGRSEMPTRSSRVGATFYVLWGVIHVIGGAVLLQAALSGTDAFLQAQAGGSAFEPTGLSGNARTLAVAGGAFAFHAYNLTWLGMAVAAVAICLNWRNSATGYWLNLALVGFTDVGLLLFIVGAGVMTWADAWIGPALFVPAWVFSTIGLRSTSKGGVSGASPCPAPRGA